MMTHDKLVEFYRKLRDDKVLSIYLDAQASDPAQRNVWRRRLDQQVDRVEKRLGEVAADEKAAFHDALALLRKELGRFDGFVTGKGWVGFATPAEVLYSESVPVPMPDLVAWEHGLRVAPYVRGLKQGRAVVIVLADRRHARVFEYRRGEVSELPGVLADKDVGDLSDMGVAKRGATHTGVRGQTGTDAAQRFLAAGSERMLKGLAENLVEHVNGHGLLILGGPQETVAAILQMIPPWMAERTLEYPSLHVDMTLAEVKDAAEECASVLTNQLQEGMVTQVLDMAHSGGRGCLGAEATERALLEGRVDTLLLSRTYIRENPDHADHCVGTAFNQGANVEELSGAAADKLNAEGAGIGARLRFVLKEEED
jgi:hypothetical protein